MSKVTVWIGFRGDVNSQIEKVIDVKEDLGISLYQWKNMLRQSKEQLLIEKILNIGSIPYVESKEVYE